MSLFRTVRVVLPMIVGAVALGQAVPAAASVAVDATGASVEGPEAGRAVRKVPGRATSQDHHPLVISTAKGATNLRATSSALWVMGAEASR